MSIDIPGPTAPTKPAPLRLTRLLGSGRHGHAFVAHRHGTPEESPTVVVKVGADGGRRIRHEGAALAQFSHPAIIGLIDSTDSLLVLEHAEAGTAAGLLGERGALEQSEVAGIARSLGSALGVMHEAGWVHGDVTPDNIGVRRDGTVALLDFATASLADGSPLPQHSPAYVGSDPRTGPEIDVRALAVTLAELLGPDGDRELVADLEEVVVAVDSGAEVDVESLRSVFDGTESSRVTVGSGRPPLDRGGTADFGPRPEPPAGKPEIPSRKRWPLALVALILPLAIVAAGWAVSGSADPGVGPPADVRPAPQTLAENNARWDEAAGRLWLDGVTYPIGDPGDQVALADWNCDGWISLGVYRPGTAEWFEFDSWTAGSAAHPRPLALDGGLAVLVDAAGCAQPVGAG